METPFGENGEDDSSYNNVYSPFDEDEEDTDCDCKETPCLDHDCHCRICHGIKEDD